MQKSNKVFFNCVVQEDLFYIINDCLRFSRGVAKEFGIESFDDFDKISFEDWKDLAITALWRVKEQYDHIHKLYRNEGTDETWSTLYYMMLAYAYQDKERNKSFYDMEISELQEYAQKTIAWLQDLINDMREPIEDVDF